MPLIHMVMAQQDEEYLQRLTQWFRENKPQQFQISAFTEEESFIRYLQENEATVDVIVMEEKFLKPELSRKGNLIILGQAVPDLPSVEKYQPVSSLCSAIMSQISQWHHELPKWQNAGKSDLTVCISPDSLLKSTLALSLAMASSDYLYTNLEAFPFYALQPEQSRNRNISDIFYHIKASKGNLAIALESAVCSTERGISFIPPMDNPQDLWELTDKETSILAEAFASWGRFSNIIMDIELNTSPRTIQWLENATYIVVPFTLKRLEQTLRLKNMLRRLTNVSEDKLRWVLAGEGSDEELDESYEGFERLYTLPWLEAFPSDWKGSTLTEPMRGQLKELLQK